MRIDFFAPAIASTTGWSPESDGVTKNDRTLGPVPVPPPAPASVLATALVLALGPAPCARVHAIAPSRTNAMLRRMSLDGTKPVRKGEELDVPALARFLDVPAEQIQITQFPGGHSNLTYLVTIGDRELVLRRPPFGNTVKTAHDMGREVRMLTRLGPHYEKAPRVVASTEDESILGAPFYLMERVRGVVIRRKMPEGTTPEKTRAISELVVDGLAELHAIDLAKNGLLDLGKPEGFVERQVRGWSERYVAAQTDDIPDMPALTKWLAENLPASGAPTIVHNDWKLDNLVLDEDLAKIVGVLDWEMSTIGDPLMDVGTTLSYWVEAGDDELLKAAAFTPTAAQGSLTRREVIERYALKSGRDLSRILFYYVFALFKTAVVAQQIYTRYKKGLTADERFASFIWGVRALAAQAKRALETNEI
jgi:aminoglycoside phosphotransferase (APT) family kinase protein